MNDSTYIYANKYKTSFSAILKMADGTVLENGQALVSVENQSIDFASEFVPLFSMGTPLEIVRVFRGEEIHSFTGVVYLSSERLIRLTSVQDTIAPNTEKYYMFPLEAAAQLYIPDAQSPKPQGGLFRRKKQPPVPLPEYCDVRLTGIAQDAMEFTTPTELPQGQRFFLTMKEPFPFEQIPLEVKRLLQFGINGQNCFCRITSLPKAIRGRWEEFIRQLHWKTNKLF